MNTKLTITLILFVSVLLCMIGLQGQISQTSPHPKMAPIASSPSRGEALIPLKSLRKSEITESPQDWTQLTPLSEAEEQKFTVVTAQISHLYAWGEMSPDQIDEFRTQVSAMGERGIAHITRRLEQVSETHIKDKEEAYQRIDDIDALQYFAKAGWPIAVECIKHLALRTVDRDGNGAILDRPQAAITWEAFVVLSRIEPDTATAVMHGLPPQERRSYIHHFAMGRKLAGLTAQQIETDVSERFGGDYVADIYPPEIGGS